MSRIFSGIQPSGEPHIGNYLGALKNWVALQHEFDSIFSIVDYHAITLPQDPEQLRQRRREMAIAILAAGIDPERTTLMVQSEVPEHTELAWIFNTVTPFGELERQTQFKEKAARQESVLAGIFTYPVLQAADILLYRADLVPVGEDQVQHLELSRVIARRWNAQFGPPTGAVLDDGSLAREAFFPEPKPLLTPTRRIMGLDGQAKMSKSMGNTIGMLEPSESIWAKLRPAVTDPKRIRKTDPGTPEVCNIYRLHEAFSEPATVAHVAQQCRTAGWGCIDCKRVLHESMDRELTPIRRRAEEFTADPALVNDALASGAARCRTIARETMAEVRDRMGFPPPAA
jgi:tryptophanyl-tRNA synthetase